MRTRAKLTSATPEARPFLDEPRTSPEQAPYPRPGRYICYSLKLMLITKAIEVSIYKEVRLLDLTGLPSA